MSARDEQRRLSRQIIAWDGEGVSAPDGEAQPYMLLRASTGEQITAQRHDGLDTRRTLTFMLATAAQHKGARHVAYGITYDGNMWLKDLPRDLLDELVERGRCYWGDFTIEFSSRHSFAVSNRASGRSVTIWDIQPWFGCRLSDAVRGWLGKDYPGLETFKARRAHFQRADLDAIAAYTQCELDATVALADELLHRLSRAGVRPGRLDGAGAAAAWLLRTNGVKEHMSAKIPAPVSRAAHHAYYGGRIETMAYGRAKGPLFQYDIHSAYPWAMTQLPSLAGATWIHDPAEDLAHFADTLVVDNGVYRVCWNVARSAGLGASPWYPFSWRDRDGGVFYPSAGETWVWGPELRAYLEHRKAFDIGIEIVDGWHLQFPREPRLDTVQPFAWVRDVYAQRVQLERGRDPAATVVKLSMAALYGKVMQRRGFRDDEPPYYQLEWAGLITSHIRARLIRLAAQNPSAVIAFTTDGVIATQPLGAAPGLGEGLGEWSIAKLDEIVLVQSGVYLTRTGRHWEASTRSYNPRALAPDASREEAMRALRTLIVDGWKAGADSVDVPQTRFVTMASGHATKWEGPTWRAWLTESFTLELRPQGKRVEMSDGLRAHRELVRSQPTPIVESLGKPKMSTAYGRTWSVPESMQIEGVEQAIIEDEIDEAIIA